MAGSTSKRINTWFIDRMTWEFIFPYFMSLMVAGAVVNAVLMFVAETWQQRCVALAEEVRVAPDLLTAERTRTLLEVERCIP